MTSFSSNSFRPFKNLKTNIKALSKAKKESQVAPSVKPQPSDTAQKPASTTKEISFREIVKGITPIVNNKTTRPVGPLKPKTLHQPPAPQKALGTGAGRRPQPVDRGYAIRLRPCRHRPASLSFRRQYFPPGYLNIMCVIGLYD